MKDKREVWHPAPYEAGDVRAIQALVQYAQLAEVAWDENTMGPAPNVPSPWEVKRALDWIIHRAAQTYDDPFTPGQPDVAQYVMGRRSVGLQIVKLMRLKPAAIFDNKDNQTNAG